MPSPVRLLPEFEPPSGGHYSGREVAYFNSTTREHRKAASRALEYLKLMQDEGRATVNSQARFRYGCWRVIGLMLKAWWHCGKLKVIEGQRP